MSKVIRRPDMTLQKTAHVILEQNMRRHSFAEVEKSYSDVEANKEADRCMDCPGRYCEQKCPLHVPIPDMMRLVRAGDYEQAYQLIRTRNPMPGVTGRVCPQEKQCESDCTRAIKGETVSIGGVERFLADWHKEHGTLVLTPRQNENGKRVAIVGSGPAGLACAERIALAGCKVAVYEKQARLGGAVGCEIPAFVLPQESLEAMLDELRALGVLFHENTQITCLDDLRNEYDAVLIATGAEVPIEINEGTASLSGVVQAKDYLSTAQRPKGHRVLVIGGGDTAIDVARTAVRDGAEQTAIVYRRTQTEMPARKHDLELAQQEGIQLYTLLSPLRFSGADGRLQTAEFCRMELTEPDYPGGRSNVKATDKIEQYNADLVILALGFQSQPLKGMTVDSRGRMVVTKDGVTTDQKGIFAGGDAVSGASTVAKAIASGRNAARAIQAYLGITESED